jgi:ATP-binding cassette, subfamily F, member 3
LDLEAVLWLQSYLQTYQHTVLLVSHDRSFLNEVCTDVMLFKNLKLTYYRGNYDAFESTDKEMKLVQQRQHESQMVKVQHMQVGQGGLFFVCSFPLCCAAISSG